MTEFDLSALADALRSLKEYPRIFDGILGERNAAMANLNIIAEQCDLLSLPHAASTARTAKRWFAGLKYLINEPKTVIEKTRGEMSTHLDHVEYAVINQLGDIRFFALAPDRVKYYDNIDEFGSEVTKAFPSAEPDIREGLKCLALEVDTASVFHFMRVAEYGLRALANDRQIQLPKGRVIELATWEDIIRQLEDSEKKIHTYPATAAREEQYAFYHGALMEVRRFKNVFRNRVAHIREDYDRNQAMSVFTHVSAFMKILAERISENQPPLPEIWL